MTVQQHHFFSFLCVRFLCGFYGSSSSIRWLNSQKEQQVLYRKCDDASRWHNNEPFSNHKTSTTISMSSTKPSSPPKCRVAIVGAQQIRVAKVTSLLLGNESYTNVAPLSLMSTQIDTLPQGVPPLVEIEYLPCVATFDSYEDEHGAAVRYLVKLEYHGTNGTLARGKSLAPFFDEANMSGDDNGDEPGAGEKQMEESFPGIAAVAVGCGVESDDDVEKIKVFLNTLSQATSQAGPDDNNAVIVECIKPNPEYSSMKDENEAYRDLDEDAKKEAAAKGTIGPGKMAKFAHGVGGLAIHQRWKKELTDAPQQTPTVETQHLQTEPEEEQNKSAEIAEVSPPSDPLSLLNQHSPSTEQTRYACKRCRSILFGEADLEDPPHAQSLHNFRKKGPKAGYGNNGIAKKCANIFLAQSLPWMNELNDLEGKLHCPKCQTKVGHYSWTGAQCSCGTWVTPAIMVPVSKVDEMRPISENVLIASGGLFVDPVRFPAVAGVDPRGDGIMGAVESQINGMAISE